MAYEVLKIELIKTILGSMGIDILPNFGKVGVSTDSFIIDKKITISYFDNDNKKLEETFNVHCGKLTVQDKELKVMTIYMLGESNDNCNEFILSYKYSDSPVMLIKLINETGEFKFLQKTEDNWREVSLLEMLNICSVFVSIMEYGLTWTPSNDSELYKFVREGIFM